MDKDYETAVLGGGCFWCTEAVFLNLNGVKSVTSGYSGGEIPNPTYKQVCSGNTGHAEAIKIEYDPELISFGKILEVFFATHNPTTLNRQGADMGTQYRSVIFFMNDKQKSVAQDLINNKEEIHEYDNPIVTTLELFKEFYTAEDYHQNYFENNPNSSYCSALIPPKLKKVYEKFPEIVKKK